MGEVLGSISSSLALATQQHSELHAAFDSEGIESAERSPKLEVNLFQPLDDGFDALTLTDDFDRR